MKKRPTPERVKMVQELRRSNAAQPVQSKKAYSRKAKYKEEMYAY